jgi:hypothetical protein
VTSTKASKKRTRAFAGTIAAVVVSVVVALLVLNIIYQKEFSPAGLIFGIAVVGVILGLFCFSNWSRLNALQRNHPGAFATNIVMYPQFLQQLSDAGRAFGIDVSAVGRSKSGALLVDRQAIRMFVGSGAPREVASFPALSVRGVRITDSAQGSWTLSSLEVELGEVGQTFLLDFCLTRKAWPGILPPRALELQVQAARAQLPGPAL